MRADASEYELVSPGTLDAVLSLLAQHPGEWTAVAGGTELMVQFNAGRLKPHKLVNICGLPELSEICDTPDCIRIGAGVTYSAIRGCPSINAALPLLARAASWTGSIANQNRGTLGGNLVNGSPAADSPPALLVYDAVLELVSVRGTRRIQCADFYTGYKQTQLAADELVLAIEIARPAAGLRQYLRKVGPRNAQAISKVALAACARCEDGTLRDVRVALASVSHAPFRCRATESLLEGKVDSDALVQEALGVLVAEIAPLDDIRSTARYRRQVAANLLEEFLQQLLQAQP